ncbi:hypothetical protein J6590_060238 [Homalodisca vitripennis]|nr:hypothetical protein J6590_060238 [Homalodisca vitripennis]
MYRNVIDAPLKDEAEKDDYRTQTVDARTTAPPTILTLTDPQDPTQQRWHCTLAAPASTKETYISIRDERRETVGALTGRRSARCVLTRTTRPRRETPC